jgi:hypothetical protein
MTEDRKIVAYLFQHEDTGVTIFEDAQQVEWGFEKSNPRWQKICPIYSPKYTEGLESRVKELEEKIVQMEEEAEIIRINGDY